MVRKSRVTWRAANMTRTPVVFIHGLWLHATSWTPWVELFSQAGYDPVAPGWPGDPDTVEAARANPDSIADHGIDDVTSHYIALIGQLPARPILIGHSFGGMIAEKLLGLDYGAAAVAVDAAQIKGVLPLPLSALHSTLPVFRNPASTRRSLSPPSSSATASATRSAKTSPTSCTSGGRSRRRASPCSRRRRRTSRCTRRPRSTPATRDEDRCCSSWAARITPCPRRSPSPR